MGGSWCKGDKRRRQDGLEKDDMLWLPLIEGKGRKEKTVLSVQLFYLNKMLCPLMRHTGKTVCGDYSIKRFFLNTCVLLNKNNCSDY